MKRKYAKKDIERLLRTPEAAQMLHDALQAQASQDIGWLAGPEAEGLSAQERLAKAREVKERIKQSALCEAARIQAQGGAPRRQKPAAAALWRLRRAPRFAAAALACLLLGGFFLTKPGMAMAKSAYAALAQWLGGTLQIQQPVTTAQAETNPLNYAGLPETFASPAEAAAFLQRPVAVVQSEEAVLESIEAMKEENIFITLLETYTLRNGQTFMVRQDFFDPAVDSVGSGTKSSERPQTYRLPNGATIYYGPDGYGDTFGLASWEYGQLVIEGTELDVETLSALIKEITFVSM